jgi:NAD(P)H dehydrogenase (quinone)
MIAILGAFGRTGRVAGALLESNGASLVRRVTRSRAHAETAGAREVVQARLSDDAELGRALHGARAVYAMLPDDLGAESFRAERRAMAEAMTRAIRRAGVERVVLLSSLAAALGEHGRNGFGADLAYFERLLAEAATGLTILRASYFQDNLIQILPSAARDRIYPNLFASRDTLISTIATQDVGEFAAQVLLEPAPRETEIVDLVGPSYSPTEMAAVVGELLGRPLAIVDVPADRQEQSLRQAMSAEAARAMIETLECLGSGRALRQGQRTLHGQTRLDQVLRTALSEGAPVDNEVQP